MSAVDWIGIPHTRATWGMVDGVNRFYVYLSTGVPGESRRWRAYDTATKRYIGRSADEAGARALCEATP